MISRLRFPKSVNGLMLDTNIFNRLLEDPSKITELADLGKPLYITHVQADELNDTKDAQTRRMLLGKLKVVISEDDLPTYGFVLDVSRLDNAYLTDGGSLSQFISSLDSKTKSKNLKSKPGNNPKDALIAETAHENSLTLLTDDERLFKTAQEFGYSALFWRSIK